MPAIVAASARPAVSSSDRARPVLEERVVLGLAQALDGLPGERLEGGPPLALLERGDVLRRAGPGRDQLADDDVLLQADQVVPAPLMAASVSTRVVSWKEAAARKD